MNNSGAVVALTIRHQLPHRLRFDLADEISTDRLELIGCGLQRLDPDLAVRAAAHRRGVVVFSRREQQLCPALVAQLLHTALSADAVPGPPLPPEAWQRWLGETRQSSIKVLMALAIAGWALPILPGTPFFLLAWCLGWRPEEQSAEAQLQPSSLQPST